MTFLFQKKIIAGVLLCATLSPLFFGTIAYGQTNGAGEIGPSLEQGVPPTTQESGFGFWNSILTFFTGFTTEQRENLSPAITINDTALAIPASIMKVAGKTADIAIGYSILGTIGVRSIYKAPVIAEGWTIFRDLVNVIFIFIVIYIGLSTILGLMGSNMKQLLARVVIIALLINFSMVLAGVIIDAGNILALSFYKAFPPDTTLGIDGRSLSYPIAQGGKIDRIIGTAGVGSLGNILGALGLSIVGGSVLMMITAFVFFAVAVLFLIRTALLWFLLMISPLAFAAYILPETQKYWSKWLNTLLSNVFWAPAFLALFYVAAKIFLSDAFTTMLAGSWEGAILSYGMVIVLVLASLTISKSMGAYAASTVTSYAQRKMKATGWATSGFAYRNTVGRGANRMLNSETASSLRRSDSWLGRHLVLKPLESIRKGKGGGGTSYADIADRRKSEIENNIRRDRSSPQALSEYIGNLKGDEQQHAYEKLSARDRAAIDTAWLGSRGQAYVDSMRNRLTPEEQEKTIKATSQLRKDTEARANKEALRNMAINPGAYTDAQVAAEVSKLRQKSARDLTHEARMNSRIIQNLDPTHLADLMAEGELTDTEKRFIYSEITGVHALYPKKTKQMAYMARPEIDTLWR